MRPSTAKLPRLVTSRAISWTQAGPIGIERSLVCRKSRSTWRSNALVSPSNTSSAMEPKPKRPPAITNRAATSPTSRRAQFRVPRVKWPTEAEKLTPTSPLVGHEHGSGGDQRNPEPVWGGQPLAQEGDPEHGHKHHAQLVNRRDPRGVSELQGSEVAHPRPARGQPREDQKKVGPARDGPEWLPLAGGDQDG